MDFVYGRILCDELRFAEVLIDSGPTLKREADRSMGLN